LRDPNRPAELIGGFAPGKDAAEIRQSAVDHEPSLLRAHDDSLQRIDLLRLGIAWGHGPADAEHAKPVCVAETGLEFLELGRGLEREVHATALDLDIKRLAGANADDALHIREVVDFSTLDGKTKTDRMAADGLG